MHVVRERGESTTRLHALREEGARVGRVDQLGGIPWHADAPGAVQIVADTPVLYER